MQNEPMPLVSVQDKLEFIQKLEQAGCSNIEVGSFVSPKWIPQMRTLTVDFCDVIQVEASRGDLVVHVERAAVWGELVGANS